MSVAFSVSVLSDTPELPAPADLREDSDGLVEAPGRLEVDAVPEPAEEPGARA